MLCNEYNNNFFKSIIVMLLYQAVNGEYVL